MWYARQMLLASLLALMAADVRAGWLFESREQAFESRRNSAKHIGVAKLRDVHQLSEDEVERVYGTGHMSDRPAFALRAEFQETLRGMPSETPLKVPFSFIHVPENFRNPKTTQQRKAYLEGREAVVIVLPGNVPQQPTVVKIMPVETDETLKLWRKLTALWNTTDLKQRRSALLAGCRDPLPRFQDYCCRRLANWSGGKPDQNAAEQLEPLAALPVIWKRFVDPETSQEVLTTCDEILGRMSPGWRTHPVRYDVLAAALRRHSRSAMPPEDSQIDFNLFLQKLSALSHFPGKEREAYQFFDEVIQSAPRRYGPIALSHLSYLYRPHSQAADQQRLNHEIWNRLVAASAKPETAESAAFAIYNIARDYAYVGSLPAQVSEALAGPRDELPRSVAVGISSSFDHLRKDLPRISLAAPVVERLRKEDYQNLTVPTQSQRGKKVVFVANPGHSLERDSIFGHAAWSSWCSWYDEPVWIEKPADWPQGGTGLMVVTGTLAERLDVPVFRLDADVNAPFQIGLPVPAGHDAAVIKRRYILVDVRWQLVN